MAGFAIKKKCLHAHRNRRAEQRELSRIAEGVQVVQALWKAAWEFLTRLNILSPYDPGMALHGRNYDAL